MANLPSKFKSRPIGYTVAPSHSSAVAVFRSSFFPVMLIRVPMPRGRMWSTPVASTDISWISTKPMKIFGVDSHHYALDSCRMHQILQISTSYFPKKISGQSPKPLYSTPPHTQPITINLPHYKPWSCPWLIPYCVNTAHNAIASVYMSVCPSVCFYYNFWTKWPLTLTICVCTSHGHNAIGLKVKVRGQR